MLWTLSYKKFFNLGLCLLSSVLLILAFPKTDFWLLSWVGLIPLFSALEGQNFRVSFGLAYLCGFIFFSATLYWFVYVTVVGAILLWAYLAVYFGIFGLGYSFFARQKTLKKIFTLSSLWVILEFTRAHFLTGFDWSSLGYSQYKNLTMIQIADVAGAYGVSFLILWVNIFLKEILVALRRRSIVLLRNEIILTAVVIAAVFLYGVFQLSSRPNVNTSAAASIAVIQPNIPQGIKWQDTVFELILDKHIDLTRKAALDHPQLIIWPETAFTDLLKSLGRENLFEYNAGFERIKNLAVDLGIPILLGAVVQEQDKYYNSALLVPPQGQIDQRYDKVHLVPFGEYIPWRSFFPFLAHFIPIADFTPGQEWTVFRQGQGVPFSILICFEDTIASLARRFVRQGASILINITNDAWFEDTKAPFMHLQSCVFRTIENRRPMVRSANTGVSCFIDEHGEILKTVTAQGKNKKMTYVEGFLTRRVPAGLKNTFYTKFGDLFTSLCLGCILWGAWKEIKLRRANR